MTLLTIAIPTYNRAEACIRTVKKFISQIETNNLEGKVELLISDNCSEDNTYEELQTLQKSYSRILTVNRNNENLGFAKNCLYLINNCSGEYIWTCGDDDIYDENSVKTIVKHLEEKDLIYLFVNCLWPNNKCKGRKGVEISQDFSGSFIESMNIIRDSASYMSLNIVKTKLLKEAPWNSETWILYEKVVNINPVGSAYVLSEPLVKYGYANKETNWFFQEEKFLSFLCEMLFFVLNARENKVLSRFRFYMLDLYGRQLEAYLNNLRRKEGLKNFNQYKYRKYKRIYHILLTLVILELAIIIYLFIL